MGSMMMLFFQNFVRKTKGCYNLDIQVILWFRFGLSIETVPDFANLFLSSDQKGQVGL